MEKEKLSEELHGKVGENSLSARTWDDYLEHSVIPFLPTEEDKISEYLNSHANVLKSINGQLNHEVASKVNEFKKTYKPEEPNVEPVSTQQPEIKETKLDELEARLSKFEQAEIAKNEVSTRTKKLEEVKTLMKEQGASHETVLNLIIPQLEISKDTTLQDLAKKGKQLYDKAYSDLYGDTYVPAFGTGLSTNGKKQSQDAYLKHLKETGRIQ